MNLMSDMEDIRGIVNNLKDVVFEERNRNDLMHQQLSEVREALLLSQAEDIARLECILQKDAVVERHQALALAMQGLCISVYWASVKQMQASTISSLIRSARIRLRAHLL
jgi:hypothetical protein